MRKEIEREIQRYTAGHRVHTMFNRVSITWTVRSISPNPLRALQSWVGREGRGMWSVFGLNGHRMTIWKFLFHVSCVSCSIVNVTKVLVPGWIHSVEKKNDNITAAPISCWPKRWIRLRFVIAMYSILLIHCISLKYQIHPLKINFVNKTAIKNKFDYSFHCSDKLFMNENFRNKKVIEVVLLIECDYFFFVPTVVHR